MANLKELNRQLRDIHAKNEQSDLSKKIDLCFKIMELYSNIGSNYRTLDNKNNCCYAAIIISGIIQKKLGNRVATFLKEYGDHLPERAFTILSGNIMRMNGY